MTTMREIKQVITDLIHRTKHNEYNDAVVNMQYKGLVHMIEDYASQKKPAKEGIPRAWAEYIMEKRKEGWPDATIIYGAGDHINALNDDKKLWQKFNRAVVNGYTAEPEKKYLLPMPTGIAEDPELKYYAWRMDDGEWARTVGWYPKQEAISNGYTVTQAQIDSAPAWVKALEKVEVEEDER